jgi:hypothetical protein
MDGDAIRHRIAPFALDAFAMARVQRREEVVEAGVAGIVPVNLILRPQGLVGRKGFE